MVYFVTLLCIHKFHPCRSWRMCWGRGNKPHRVWENGRNYKIHFSIIFNVVSEEFYQLETIGNLFLGSPNVFCQPPFFQRNPSSPLRPHSNVHVIPVQNPIPNTWDNSLNEGWNPLCDLSHVENKGWGQIIASHACQLQNHPHSSKIHAQYSPS